MTTIHRVVIAPYCAASMYQLVADIDAYPQFLPWCQSVTRPDADNANIVRLNLFYRGLKTSFSTHNTYTPPQELSMQLVDGPLSKLAGRWQFVPIEANRCRVELTLEYQFNQWALQKLFSPLFAVVFDRFVDDFMARAKQLYGTAGKGFMAIEIVDANDKSLAVQQLIVPAGSTVENAFKHSGHPLPSMAMSVYGTPCTPQTVLQDGDRVEINAPLVMPPTEQRRQRAKQ